MATARERQAEHDALVMQTHEDLERICKSLEFIITCTPTGDVRTKLTEVNIHAMQTRDAWIEAVEMAVMRGA